MISTYTPPPILSAASETAAPPAGPGSAPDDNAPSFQTRLDQQTDQYHAGRAPAQAPTRRDDTEDADAASATASAATDPTSSTASDSVSGARSDDSGDVKRADASEDKDKTDKPETAAAPVLPFSAVTLALAGSLAPLPPVAPTPAPALVEQGASIEQAKSVTALIAGGSAAIPGPFKADLITASPALSAPARSPLLPGVSMDSAAAGKTAAPGVASAFLPKSVPTSVPNSLPASVPLPVAPAASPLPDTAPPGGAQNISLPAPTLASTLASTLAARAEGAAPGAQAVGLTADAAATSSASLTAKGATAPASGEGVLPSPLAAGTNGVLPAAAQSPLIAGAAQASVAVPISTTPDTAAAPHSSQAAVTLAANLTAAPVVPAVSGAAESSATDTALKEQHLDGLERLRTLGAGAANTADTAAASAIPDPSANATPGIARAATGENVAAASEGRPGHVSYASSAASGAAGAAAPNGAKTLSASTATLAAPALPATLSGAANPILTPLNGTARAVEALLTGGKIAGSGPAPSIAPEGVSADTGVSGAGATGSLFAPVEAQGQAASGNSGDRQARSDAQGQSGENASSEPSAAGINGVSAPATSGQAATVAGTASAAGSGASSQIDRAQIVAQVTQHLEGMRLANGNGEMRLQLTPGHLGTVQVSVASHQDGVVARISVETAQIQQVMDGAKAHLRAGLEARGLHVQSVEVTVTPQFAQTGQSAYSQQRGSESAGERLAERAAYGRAASIPAPAADAIVPIAARASLARAAASRLDCQA